MVPLISLFWTSGDVSSGFQSQIGQPSSHFGRGICDMFLRFTSGVTPLPVYIASIAASHLPLVHVSEEVGCWDLSRRPSAWQLDTLTT